jgi:hypothetical protein
MKHMNGRPHTRPDGGLPFHPAEFARLTREQWPHRPALCEAWLRCTRHWPESTLYTHFVAPAEHALRWKFASGFQLQHPALGTLIVDVLRDGSIGGMEYLDRVLGRWSDVHTP